MYINEVIRVTYKCNFKCKFCNILKVNNYGENDIFQEDIIKKILLLRKRYGGELQKLLLSFSGGEPTLIPNLDKYIKLAKKLGVGMVEIQTNGGVLFKNHEYTKKLFDAGLDGIFLSQHSNINELNSLMGCSYDIDEFLSWIKYINETGISKKIKFSINIVINKLNLFYVIEYLKFLKEKEILKLLPKINYLEKEHSMLSCGIIQPNGYAKLNKNKVLLKYTEEELNELNQIMKYAEDNKIFLDFHYTAPPLCILNFPDNNLEYKRLLEKENIGKKSEARGKNFDLCKINWKEKIKFDECINCKYNNYCKGMYTNWIEYVGNKYAQGFVFNFLKK